jgi:hypothetical protein
MKETRKTNPLYVALDVVYKREGGMYKIIDSVGLYVGKNCQWQIEPMNYLRRSASQPEGCCVPSKSPSQLVFTAMHVASPFSLLLSPTRPSLAFLWPLVRSFLLHLHLVPILPALRVLMSSTHYGGIKNFAAALG